NGLGNLQRGKHHANMDFILFQSILNLPFCWLLLSYDIVCQYSHNLFQRMKQLPSSLQLPERLTKQFSFVIPKFHLYSHGMQCQLCYSGNLLQWSVQSDLKDPEHWWVQINLVSMLTNLMSPWSCCEIINDHTRGWNWCKIIQFGMAATSTLCWELDGAD
ncbi:hypothetical protein BDN71DRAFT_1398280, partial [Pleurotus eryngii]